MAERRGYTLDEPRPSVGGASVYAQRRATGDVFVGAFVPKVGVAELRRSCSQFLEPLMAECRGEAVLVLVSTSQTTFSRDVHALVDALNASPLPLRFEVWTLVELQVDVVAHSLVPAHWRVDASALPLDVTVAQCEVLSDRDPVARRHYFRVGELVAIDRVDSQSGTERTFRRVVRTNAQ